VTLKTRDTVPSYILAGYKLKAVICGYADIPLERIEATLPHLKPGEEHAAQLTFKEPQPTKAVVTLERPTGDEVATLIWVL
ncbi:MAG TPA: hypothetical protein VGL72_29625, partial [Bryobacteraceae bacterium]